MRSGMLECDPECRLRRRIQILAALLLDNRHQLIHPFCNSGSEGLFIL
jgi:hypothetical protein